MDLPFLADELIDARPWDPLLGAAVVASVALVPLVVKIGNSFQRRRTERLRAEFGNDYDRIVEEHGDLREAERTLMRLLKERGRARDTNE